MTTHEMFDGRLQLYKRPESRVWQCAARVGERRFRQSTKEENLDRAKDVAEEWYLDLRGKLRGGEILKPGHTFSAAAQGYLKEIKVLAVSDRSPKYVELLELRLNRHIIPFFGKTPIKDVNRGLVQAYRAKRAEETIARTAVGDEPGKPPARSTMTNEIVHIRQVLKWAEGMGWIPFVPNLTPPYKTQGKRGRRAWFSPEEYQKLYTATRRRIAEGKRPGWKSQYEDLHDFVLFMANTGLRPDEAMALEFRDVKIEADAATKETILVIDVRGKTGVRYSKSMPGAVQPLKRLIARREKELAAEGETAARTVLPTERLFRKFPRSTFNKVLEEEGLKFDRDGKRRTAYSLRHTYISTRLMGGADIYQIANNCGTSVKMIEEFYASHIKDRLDAAAINVQRKKRTAQPAKAKTARRTTSARGEKPADSIPPS
jgi:integrase